MSTLSTGIIMNKVFLFLLFSFELSASIVPQRAQVVLGDDYNNGYPEKRYHQVLDLFIDIYSPYIESLGGSFHIKRDFRDGAVNAWAWRTENEYHLEVPGGMSRYYLINEEGFISTICHELGHLLGGAPTKGYLKRISVEGQADFYVGRCTRHILGLLEPYKEIVETDELKKACEKEQDKPLCMRALAGAKSLASYYAKLENSPTPSLIKESTREVKSTTLNHPPSQCRLDTMKKSFFCPVSWDSPTSGDDKNLSQCFEGYFPEYSRPKCWFKTTTKHQH